MEVNLGAVESAVALVEDVGHLQLLQRVAQAGRGHFPHFLGANVVLGHGGQLHLVLKAKGLVDELAQFIHADDLILHVLLCHVQVGVILREAAHAHQAMQGAGFFMPVHNAQLTVAHGQVAVAPQLALVG